MMYFFLVNSFFWVALLFIKANGKIQILTPYVIIWGFASTMVNSGLLGINRPSLFTNAIIFLSMLIVVVTYLIVTDSRIKIEISNMQDVNYKALLIINFVAFLLLLPMTIKSIQILKSNTLGYLRAQAFTAGGGISDSTMQLLFAQQIIQPIFLSTIIIAAIKNKPLLVVWAIIDAIAYSITFAGRLIFIQFVFMFVAVGFISRRKRNIVSTIVILLTILVPIIITLSRSMKGFGLLENLYIYYVGSISFFDHLYKGGEFGNYITGRTFGSATFGFIYNTVYAVLSFIFGFNFRGSDYKITTMAKEFVPIGNGIYYNALSTYLTAFYSDMRIVGIIFGSVFWGAVSAIIQKLENTVHSNSSKFLWLYFSYIMFDSILIYRPLFIGSVIPILLIFLIRKRNEIKYPFGNP